MQRLLILGLVLTIAHSSPQWHSASSAQEITITIKKGDREARPSSPFDGKRPAVDLAILLDTSNSMDGLISQAKSQLWKIVQQFADAEQAGQTPTLRVAVFEYGNTNLPASEGYIRQVVQLTDDLDKVSEALFGLKTKGGDEYCGQVISEAILRLDWSQKRKSYKAIFIAGNEPFTQGPVSYEEACSKAAKSRILVNTIHCGNYQEGVNGKWKHGAELAEGQFMNINQDQKVVHIDCPQDKIIIQLNDELNKTYLWFGKKSVRDGYLRNQIAQDRNALQQSGGGGFAGGRAATKSGKLYRNDGRDLVDTLERDKDILSKVKVSDLPEKLQKMSVAERKAYIEQLAEKRAEIKKKIAKLMREREALVQEAIKNSAKKPGEESLGDAISATVREQLEESGFEIKE